MQCDNIHCRYDFETNELGLHIELKPKSVTQTIKVHCPVCGKTYRAGLSLATLGVCPRGGERPEYVQWRRTTQRRPMFTVQGAVERSIDDICFPEMPVFRGYGDDGKPVAVVPHLPVRPEYLEFVDLDKYRAREVECRGKIDSKRNVYVARLPLKNMESPVEIERPLVDADWEQGLNPANNAIHDADVSIWPRVRCEQWQTFIVDVEAPNSSKLGEPRVFVHVPDGRNSVTHENSEALKDGVFELKRLPFDGFTRDAKPQPRFAAIFRGQRPSMICLQWQKAGRSIGGAFVALAPLTKQETQAGPELLRVGIDFGTSNSCVAFDFGSSERKPRVTSVGDTYEHLLQGHDPDKLTRPENTHPRFSTRPFGKNRETFASEILMRSPPSRSVADIKRLRPGLDVAALGADFDWDDAGGFRDELIKGGLKWADSDVSRAFRATYLKALSIQALAARLIESERDKKHIPERIQISYSYPGVWSPTEREQLEDDLRDAWLPLEARSSQGRTPWAVCEWFKPEGGYTLVEHGTSESLAAARLPFHFKHVNEHALQYRPRILVDVGGGTTDVSFLWVGQTEQSPRVVVENMLSIKYAGDNLLRALGGEDARGSCFRTQNPDMVQRRVRKDGAQLNMFAAEMARARDARVNTHWRQLTEYLSRLIAAPFHSGSAMRRNPDILALKRVPVDIVLLGNGLGLAKFVNSNFESLIPGEIEARVKILLPKDMPRVEICLATPSDSGVHPKHAVAVGLLQENRDFDNAAYVSADALNRKDSDDLVRPSDSHGRRPWTSRSILGLTFMTFSDGHRRYVEWWRDVDDLASEGAHYERMHGPPLDRTRKPVWLPDDGVELDPSFPPEIMKEKTNFRRTLERANDKVLGRVSENGAWFKANPSPFEELLTSALTERLKTIRD